MLGSASLGNVFLECKIKGLGIMRCACWAVNKPKPIEKIRSRHRKKKDGKYHVNRQNKLLIEI